MIAPVAALSVTLGGVLATGAAPDSPYGWISTGGLVAFLLYFFLFAVPKKWVPRELYDEQGAEKDRQIAEWRDIALDSKALTRKQLTITEAALLKAREER